MGPNGLLMGQGGLLINVSGHLWGASRLKRGQIGVLSVSSGVLGGLVDS